MTVADIHKTFKLALDKNADAVAFGGCPAFLPQEIDSFLNQAYLQVIQNKFTGSLSQIPFEGSTKRIMDLQKLVKTENELKLNVSLNSNELTLNNFHENGRMFYVNSVLNFDSKKATCVLINHDDANQFKSTYNNDPWIEKPAVTIEDNTLKVYIDKYAMKAKTYSIDITYIKEPEKINYKTPNLVINEVPDSVIYEIIERAAMIALENIESQRTATKAQMSNLQE